MPLRFQEIKSPLVEKIKQQTSRQYVDGLIKITPSECVLPTMYREHGQRIKDFEIRDDDVWIVTYPKCGTTWTQEMVWLIMHDLDFEGAKVPLFDRTPFFEFWACAPAGEAKAFGLKDTIKYTEELESPRCIKSHLPKELLPDQLWMKKPKIIYVTRNVQDVVVSFYHHHKLMNGYKGSLDEFVEYFMNENVLVWDPFWKHILEFWNLRNEPYVLINSYEEMKRDLPSLIRRTAKFLDKSLSEEQVAQLSEHLQFKNMKENAALNFVAVEKLFKEMDSSISGTFMRKGEIGSALKELSKEQLDRLHEWSEQRVAGTNYPIRR